jgi:hypothetical protein
MAATINTKVTAHNGTTSVGTMFMYETVKAGEIGKVTAKSIRVRLENEQRTTNGKTTGERELNATATFTFWKNRSDNGKALYRNAEHGIITL